MPIDVLAVVIFSALLHAGWNALVRASPDKFLASLHTSRLTSHPQRCSRRPQRNPPYI